MSLSGERIVILGAGQVGCALHAVLTHQRGISCTLLSHGEADITNLAELRRRLLPLRPTILLHTAAFTKVNECERDPERAFAVNAGGTMNVLKVAREHEARLIYFSTDYVFPGKLLGEYAENEATRPLNIYGTSKLEGERITLEYERGTVLRTAQVFAAIGRNFPVAVFAQYEKEKVVQVVDDEFATPTYAVHLAEAVPAFLSVAGPGIYHLRGPEELTYYDFARRLFAAAGLPDHGVQPTTSQLLRLPAKRPQRAVLSMKRYFSHGLPPLPPLWQAVAEFAERSRIPVAERE